jgi:hypothetical protein
MIEDFFTWQITRILLLVRDEVISVMDACRELDRIRNLEWAAKQAYLVR